MMKSVNQLFFYFGMLFLLAACGGGGSISRDDEPVDPGPVDPTPTLTISVTMAIVDQNDESSNQLSEANPLNVVATVLDSDGNPVVDELVTFVIAPETLAGFNNDTGTALTNAQGVASIGILVGPDSGSGTVTASISSGEEGNVGFVSSGTVVAVEEPASLDLFADQSQLSSSGSDAIELRAIIRNEQNVLLPNIDVSFSANANASIRNLQTTTDENGIARAELTTLNAPENRIITAVASVVNRPELTRQLEVAVVGTELSIVGPTSVIVGDSTDITVLLEDSDNSGIANQSIGITVVDETGLDVTSTVIADNNFITSGDGRVSIAFSAPTSGTYAISASALNTAAQFIIVVQQDQFAFVDAPDINNIDEDLPLNQFHPITVNWLRESQPLANGSVRLSVSRGTIETNVLTTDENGNATFNIQSDNAGIASVLATGTDSAGDEVTARVEVSFIATEAHSIIVDATPDAIGPDGQTSTISAVVRDPRGNRVGNKTVNFSLDDVANGQLSPPQVTTDRRGIASTVYQSNSVSSNEAVQITASVDDIEGIATLTVGDRPFDISLGTGRLIESPTSSSYRKEFSVFVTDPDGNPVPNADISLSITPLRVSEGNTFFKGTWFFDDESQLYIDTFTIINIDGTSNFFTPTGCENEDINFNGILDAGEDTNNDGQLTPGNAASITPAVVTTDANGQALAFVEYPRQFGNWVRTKITARGESGGSESRESMFFRLTVALEDLNVEGSPPPSSPYGVSDNCASID